ncbi:CD209 antigen-like protein A [Parambassis ranga]|uniref:CD209 antigen-like protein A n=1 Tax=Parambassis ranga TaxID=210632 RepID=A0A6P7H587_9TELE|nr:CD209 antigen-like protein A [Parambassis ranga]
MEEIYVNVEQVKPVHPKPSTNHTGLRRCFLAAIVCLGLLSVFLLVGLITLVFLYHHSAHEAAEFSAIKNNLTEERDRLNANLTAKIEELDRLQTLYKQTREAAAEFSAIKNNLTERLQDSDDKLSSMTEERDRLNAKLTDKIEEALVRLQTLYKQTTTCPSGWTWFGCTCYLVSSKYGSWDEGRKDCRGRGADLVVINSPKEQEFLATFTTQQSWIGLTDRDEEGKWKWVDGTPLTVAYWQGQPNNGGGNPEWGEEDCAHIRTDVYTSWNDLSCTARLKWVCERRDSV